MWGWHDISRSHGKAERLMFEGRKAGKTLLLVRLEGFTSQTPIPPNRPNRDFTTTTAWGIRDQQPQESNPRSF
jgi:hypothetical protein